MDRLRRIFDGFLFAANRSEFNDPFDCVPFLKSRLTEAERDQHVKDVVKRGAPPGSSRAHRRRLLHGARKNVKIHGYQNLIGNAFNETADSFGITSFAGVGDSMLMWAHYASSHSGICLRFRVDGEFRRAFPVLYDTERPVFSHGDVSITSEVHEALLTKADYWAYEEEWRLLSLDGRGEKPYPNQLLDGLIFGINTTKPHVEEINELLSKREGPPVETFQATLAEHEFKLLIVRR